MLSCPLKSAASVSVKISSITGLVMAKQPIDVQPPCIRMKEPSRNSALSKVFG